MKGDLHIHTLHSGGDSTVQELAEFAEIRGLDFIAITDHDDKMNGIPKAWDEITAITQQARSNTTLLYGMEWTHGVNWFTCHGHMNLWSSKPFDYSKIWEANKNDDPFKSQQLAAEQGVLYSINHPHLFGFEWNYAFPEKLPAMEIWNGAFRASNSKKTIEMEWASYFNRGIRVTAVGGSDTHDLKKQNPLTTIGNPTTWVYAKDKKATSILEGIKSGRTIVSFSPDSPIAALRTTAQNGSHQRFEIELFNRNPSVKIGSVVLYKNGKFDRQWKRPAFDHISFDEKVGRNERAWFHVVLRGDPGVSAAKQALYGKTLSISSPITFNFK